jgi:hypothetical protein
MNTSRGTHRKAASTRREHTMFSARSWSVKSERSFSTDLVGKSSLRAVIRSTLEEVPGRPGGGHGDL